jgi:hypothetical protein
MSEPTPANPYAGRRIALLTKHGKERVIAPVLEPALGCRVERVSGYDTDALGTFTREIPRAGTQLEAARRKARIGMTLSGLPLGIASEGSFGPDPFAGLFSWNVEFVVFVDDERDLEIVGAAQAPANHAHLLTGDWVEAAAFARQAAFPGQQLVVRPQDENDPRIRKGIAAWEELEAAFAWARAQAPSGQVFLETDLRAHANPTRMHNIGRAAMDLADKLGSRCPACGTPGFWIVERVPGLPCADCGTPTREPQAEIFGCPRCEYRSRRERIDRAVADPGRCDWCNP